MNRFLLTCLAGAPFALVGCGVPAPAEGRAPAGAPAGPSARYPARTDLMAIKIPEGAPTHWYAAQFPPLRSVRLLPHAPDTDLALDLRKQFNKAILDPTRYEQDVWMPAQADRVARLLDAHFGTPAAPTVRLPRARSARWSPPASRDSTRRTASART